MVVSIRSLLCSLIFFLFYFFVSSPVYASNVVEVTEQYNVKFTYTSALGTFFSYYSTDIDGNGQQDLIIGAALDNPLGRTNAGSTFIILDTLLSGWQGKNLTIDLTDPDNFSYKFYGSQASEQLSDGEIGFGDINGDGVVDLVLNAWGSRRLYIVYGDRLFNNSPSGTIIDLADSNTYDLRLTGFADNQSAVISDLNENGLADIAIGGWTTNTGYILFNDRITSLAGDGVSVSIADPTSYSVKVISSGVTIRFGNEYGMLARDMNGDGYNDLLYGSPRENFAGSQSGSVFVIGSNKLKQLSGYGNLLDVNPIANVSLRIDGASAGANYGLRISGSTGDLNDDGLLDFATGIYAGGVNGSNAGYLYAIDGVLIQERWDSGTPISLSNEYWVRFDGEYAGASLGYVTTYITDFHNSGSMQLAVSQHNFWTTSGKLGKHMYIPSSFFSLSNGSLVNLASFSSYQSLFQASGLGFISWRGTSLSDTNGDGKQDHFFLFYPLVGNGQLLLIYNFPHTLSLDPLPAHTTQESFTLTGSVSAPNSVTDIAGVEWSLDNNPRGTWTSCGATDDSFNSTSESFTCTVSGYTEGEHQIYVRAYDTNTSYTAASHYASVGKRKDTTAPKQNFILTDPITGKGYTKEFKATSLNAMDVIGNTHYPTFCFTKGYDDGAGVASYTIVVDGTDYLPNIPYTQPPVGDNGDTRQDGESVIKENNDWYLKYHLYNDVTKQQEICAYGKTDAHYLSSGVHKWSVKASDNAGNSISTDTLRFLVMTNQGTQEKPNQSVWFPLTLSQVGNRTNLTTYSTTAPELFTSSTKPLLFSDTTPIFFGIAPMGAKVELTLQQVSTDQAGDTKRTQVTSLSTSANSSSEWGINTTSPLTKGDYLLTIQATDTSDNFAILKDIPIRLSNGSLSTVTNTSNSSDSAVLGATTQAASESDQTSLPEDPSPTVMQPTPTSRPLPTPTPTPKQFCIPFTKWCW